MRRHAIAALTAGFGALLSCSEKKETSNLEPVRVGSHGRLSTSPFFIADAEGFFADEGIQLVHIETPRSTAALPMLDRGELDVMGASPTPGLYAAIDKGAKFRIVADRGHLENDTCDYTAIVGSRTSFATNSPRPDEVKGKSISINGVGTAAFVADKYLHSIGLTAKDMKVEKLSETVEAQAIELGALDMVHVSEPFVTRLKSQGHHVLARGADLAPGAHTSTVVFGPTILNGNRELGVRFMRAFLRGVRQYGEGMTPRNLEILTGRGRYEPELLRSTCLTKIDPEGRLNLDWLLEFQEWAVKAGHLDRVLGREAGTDTSFASRAAESLRKTRGDK